MSNSLLEMKNNDVIFVMGSNPSIAQPIASNYIKQAKLAGAKLIVSDPRTIDLAEMADIHLPNYAGTNGAIIQGMLSHIIKEKLYDEAYVLERCDIEGTEFLSVGWNELKKQAEDPANSVEAMAKIAGVCAEDLKKAAELYAKGPKSSIVWGMGTAQHANAVEVVQHIANLVAICGMVGKESTGANPLRGQNNVQGACDTACLALFYPGYKFVADYPLKQGEGYDPDKDPDADHFEKIWGVRPPYGQGLALTHMCMNQKELDEQTCALTGNKATYLTTSLADKALNVMYCIGSNPAHASADALSVKKHLAGLEFLVVQDIFMTETAELADVVLPAYAKHEKWGTYSNTERRVHLARPALTPPGEAKSDMEIMIELMKRLGYEQKVTNHTDQHSTSKEILAEIGASMPQYAGLTHENITEQNGIHWPTGGADGLAKNPGGTRFLHAAGFPRGKGVLRGFGFTPADEQPCDQYPVILTTGRTLYHWHAMQMTDKSSKLLTTQHEGFIEINDKDAAKWGVATDDYVKITGRRDVAFAKVVVTEDIKEGVVFSPFHFHDVYINNLTNPKLDPIGAEPELKVATVKIEKASASDRNRAGKYKDGKLASPSK
ncbi:MAG: molybdopterin-dependent oxidoreductase [Defluviitaleaceae bacterium]|nr:molybdopterin-dependent oxidoreductase [Defluviitaleaceae bacterium]